LPVEVSEGEGFTQLLGQDDLLEETVITNHGLYKTGGVRKNPGRERYYQRLPDMVSEP